MNEMISTPINPNLKRISAKAFCDAPPPPAGLGKQMKNIDSEHIPNFLPVYLSIMTFEVDEAQAKKRLCRRPQTLTPQQVPDFGQPLRFRRTIFDKPPKESQIRQIHITPEDLPPLPFPEAPRSNIVEDDSEFSWFSSWNHSFFVHSFRTYHSWLGPLMVETESFEPGFCFLFTDFVDRLRHLSSSLRWHSPKSQLVQDDFDDLWIFRLDNDDIIQPSWISDKFSFSTCFVRWVSYVRVRFLILSLVLILILPILLMNRPNG